MKYFIEKDQALCAQFEFTDFVSAFSFMNEVAFHCEKQNHHPNWSNVYNRVEIKLTTHDAGNTITAKDHKLAETIENIYGKF